MTKARRRFWMATCPTQAALPEWECRWVEIGHRSPESAHEASRKHADAAHPGEARCVASCVDQELLRGGAT